MIDFKEKSKYFINHLEELIKQPGRVDRFEGKTQRFRK